MPVKQIRMIPIGQIALNPGQPRKSMTHIKDLAESIEENGLINAISVEKHKGKYRIWAGERRFRACKEILKWKKMPCVVGPAPAYGMIAENLCRVQMSLVEEIPAIVQVLERKFGDDWKTVLDHVIQKRHGDREAKMEKAMKGIGMAPGTLRVCLPVMKLGADTVKVILDNPEYFNDGVVMKLAKVNRADIQFETSKKIARQEMTTGQAFRAISMANYKISGVSEQLAKWYDWEENFSTTFRSIKSSLVWFQEGTPGGKPPADVAQKVKVRLEQLSGTLEVILRDLKTGDV